MMNQTFSLLEDGLMGTPKPIGHGGIYYTNTQVGIVGVHGLKSPKNKVMYEVGFGIRISSQRP